MMRTVEKKIYSGCGGFSLAEMLAALVIGSMVLIAALMVYQRAQSASASVLAKVANRLPEEVLQLMAEDLDEILSADPDVKLTIVGNKPDHDFATARLEIVKTFQGSANTKDAKAPTEAKKEILEQIVWQGSWDYDSEEDGLVLYRSHSGLTGEDKLLDDNRQDWEKEYTFVPICSGVTFFRIEACKGDELLDSWKEEALPLGIKVTISFAAPVKTMSGGLEVPEESKISRTIAIDRTRKIKLNVVPTDTGLEGSNKKQNE